MKTRCPWSENTFKAYQKYHDEEWGVPVRDDQTQFEFLLLEGAQAGLSWSTILKKREGYRRAFADFDIQKVAQFGEKAIQSLLQNPEIIRNENKIRSAVNNAQCFIAVQEEFDSFNNYIWRFVNGSPVQNHWRTENDVPAKTKTSTKLAKDLKNRGFKFVGPTIIYAHMQATGMVNDHLTCCFRHDVVQKMETASWQSYNR
jgi:DNA-3-methyladenine glycosylase I